MDADREMKIQDLRARVARGEYRINPAAVADAVVRRASGLDLAGESELPTAQAPVRNRPGIRLVGVISARHTNPSAVAAA